MQYNNNNNNNEKKPLTLVSKHLTGNLTLKTNFLFNTALQLITIMQCLGIIGVNFKGNWNHLADRSSPHFANVLKLGVRCLLKEPHK